MTYAEAVQKCTHAFADRETVYDHLVELLIVENPAPRKLSARESAQRANALRLRVHTDCVKAGVYA